MIKDHLFLNKSTKLTKPTTHAIQTALGITYTYYKKVFGLAEIFSRDRTAVRGILIRNEIRLGIDTGRTIRREFFSITLR